MSLYIIPFVLLPENVQGGKTVGRLESFSSRILKIANEMQRENEVLILFLYARCNQVETADGEKFVGRLLEAKLDGQHVATKEES